MTLFSQNKDAQTVTLFKAVKLAKLLSGDKYGQKKINYGNRVTLSASDIQPPGRGCDPYRTQTRNTWCLYPTSHVEGWRQHLQVWQ